MNTAVLSRPTFSDAALRSQRVFRRVMEAFARPGLIVALDCSPDTPAPLPPAGEAVLLTLCDFETTLWVAPAFSSAIAHLRFQTDARLVASPAEAAFALVEVSDLDLTVFHPGTPGYPDRGATVIVACAALTGGPERMLTGPGIADATAFTVPGLPESVPGQLRTNRARFPLGVDLIFVSGADVVCLPRSTRIADQS